jgi:hypothetical protein
MRWLSVCFVVSILTCTLAAAGEDPLAHQPYLGLSIRDSEHGPIVGWISPGPLGGTGFSSKAGILRGDNLVALNGKPVVAARDFNTAIAALAPGDSVTIVLRRSPEATPRSAVAKGGPGGEQRVYEAELASRLAWSGTIGRGLGPRAINAAAEGEFEEMILRHASELDVLEPAGGLRDLKAHLREVQERNLDPNSLPAVVKMFERPLSLDAVEQEIAELVLPEFDRAAPAAPGGPWPWSLIAGVLDLPEINEPPGDEHEETLNTIAGLSREWRPAAEQLVRTMRRGVNLHDEHTLQSLALIRESPRLVEEILPVLAREGRSRWAELNARVEDFRGRHVLERVPEAVRAAVQGDIVHAEQLPGPAGGWLVVGGDGPNVYDMAAIAFVIDLGGDDVYVYDRTEHLAQVVIDLGGNDVHESRADFSGAATGVFAVSILDSRGGNDVFRSGAREMPGNPPDQGTHFAIGAGLFGIGLLINRAGDDEYLNLGRNSGWSTGVGLYGAGLVVDLEGNDSYHAELLSQGVGGPRGLGAIIDASGDDSYRANGPNFASVYGTEGVFVSRSQGFGFGVRSYAAGGVGAIYDLAGNDRYEAGEFAQAGGYYFGLGIIRDRRGDDTYIGNRYGQAFAAHQAGGILIDEEGNDSYWSMTAASQSGAWDQCITMLIDRSGNDTYKADGLAQGAAAMQSIAILIDLDGNDVYEGRGRSTQGHGSNNTYHYQTAGVFSFSGLFDLGGGDDRYSSGRENNSRVATGSLREDEPAESTVYGIFVDQ